MPINYQKNGIEVEEYTWIDFDSAVESLAADLLRSINMRLDEWVVYAQPRGGLALGLALAHKLGVRIITSRAEYKIRDRIIFVDDVWETGATYENFLQFWGFLEPAQVRIAVWVYKGNSDSPASIKHCHRILPGDTWALFPWENKELVLKDRSTYYKKTPVDRYPVNDIYPTIQGEGVNTGVPMMVLRLHGCDVGCPWCDTKETWDFQAADEVSTLVEALGVNGKHYWGSPGEIASYIGEYSPVQWVMLTGGEPSTYELKPLVDALHAQHKKVALETSGTQLGFVGAGCDWVCVSPKINMPGGKAFLPETIGYADELKMVIGKELDVQTLKSLVATVPAVKPNLQICLQPVSQSEKATKLCIATAHAYGWRVSIQVHKLLGEK